MAYAGDLKSPVPYGTCGFDPHPGHHPETNVYTSIMKVIFPRALCVPMFSGFESR
jgi:hypothetical protein